MNQAKKAALFNAVLFPGWGQFYLKRYKRGLIFLLPVLAAMLALAWTIIQLGAVIIKAAPFKKGTIQVSHVLQASMEAVKRVDLSYLLSIIGVIIVFWILSIIDAYQLGKKMLSLSTTGDHHESTSVQE